MTDKQELILSIESILTKNSDVSSLQMYDENTVSIIFRNGTGVEVNIKDSSNLQIRKDILDKVNQGGQAIEN